MNALVYPRTIGVKQVQRDHVDNEFYIISYVISLYLFVRISSSRRERSSENMSGGAPFGKPRRKKWRFDFKKLRNQTDRMAFHF